MILWVRTDDIIIHNELLQIQGTLLPHLPHNELLQFQGTLLPHNELLQFQGTLLPVPAPSH